MNKYSLFIINPTLGPDYTDKCEAESKEKAADIFVSRMYTRGGNPNKEDLIKHISLDNHER